MKACRLIGLAHSQWDEIKETIAPGNMTRVIRHPEYDKPEGLAYKVMYGGYHVGYIPLVPTLRGYWKDAQDDEERSRIAEWGEAVSEVREWLDSRVKYEFEEEWMVPVWQILYRNENGWSFEEGEPLQISIGFDI